MFIINGKTIGSFNTSKNKDVADVCDKIRKLQTDKNDFVIYVQEKSGNENLNNPDDIIDKIKKKYNSLTIITVNSLKRNSSCFGDVINKAGLDTLVEKQTYDYIMLYKKGEYSGLYTGIDNYNKIVNYLASVGLIVKNEPKQSTNLEKFHEDIKNDYVLFLISTDNHKEIIKPNVEKIFSDTNYDIVDVTSTEGSMIYKELIEKYKVEQFLPQGIYFKNSKMVKSEALRNIDIPYLELKKELDKNSK